MSDAEARLKAVRRALRPSPDTGPGRSWIEKLVMVGIALTDGDPDSVAAAVSMKPDLVKLVLRDLDQGHIDAMMAPPVESPIERASRGARAEVCAVECSDCGAAPGTGCRSSGGHPREPHAARQTAAAVDMHTRTLELLDAEVPAA